MIIKVLKNKELFYSILIKFIHLVNGILLIKFLTLYLSKEQYGNYAYIMSIIGLGTMIPFSSFNQGVMRFAAEYNNRELFITNNLLIYIFFYILYIMVFSIYYILNNQENILFCYALLPFLSSILFSFATWFFNGLKKQNIFFFMTFSNLFIKISLLNIFYFMGVFNEKIVLLLIFFSEIIVFSFFFYKFINFKFIKLHNIKKIFIEIWFYSYPILIWSPFVWAQSMVYRIYLEWFETTSEVAIFSIMSSLSILPATLLTGVLGTYLLPILFNDKSNILKKLTKYVFITIGFSLFMLLFIFIFKTKIIILLTSDKYTNDSWMLPYMFSSLIIYSIGNITSYIIYIQKQTKDLLFSNIIPGIFAIIVGYILIKNYGINGAMWTFIATYTLSGILNFYTSFLKLQQYKKEIK